MKKYLFILVVLLCISTVFATPLNEGFEGTTFPPEGWTVYNLGDTNTWFRSTSNSPHTGIAHAQITYHSSIAHNDWLVTPQLLPSAENHTISFWAKNYSSSFVERFNVKLSTGTIAVEDFTVDLELNVGPPATYTQYSYDLSAYIDTPVYIALQAISTNQFYLFVDDFEGPDIYIPALPPNPAIVVSPANNATNVAIDAQLNWASGGGYPTGYHLYFGDSNPPTYIGDMRDATTYDPGTLAYERPYYWRVVSYNEYGTLEENDCPIWSFTTREDPTKPLPYTQNFESGTSLSAIEWTGDMSIGSNHGTDGSNGLYCNLWSSVPTSHAITPPIGPLATESQIIFDYRYMDYYYSAPGDPYALNPGDKLEVQVSYNDGVFDSVLLIDDENHTTSTDFASITINISNHENDIIKIKFLATRGSTGDYNLDIDNVVVREAPEGGLLMVTPDPVSFGDVYVGVGASKSMQVTISNTGIAALAIGGIDVSDRDNFSLSDLPDFPLEIEPGDPATNFTLTFHPTQDGNISANLLFEDGQNSSVEINGSGVIPAEGEICETAFEITLPLADYEGNTEGLNNDYTAAMFTGVTSTSYLNGKDWVGVVHVPETGALNVSVTNAPGAPTYQYMGVFIVNTIPSLANPAPVLAQKTSTPLTIENLSVTAGDYYLIIDNYPTPNDFYFVLDVSFTPASHPDPTEPVYPADEAEGLNIALTFEWETVLFATGYKFYLGTDNPPTNIVDGELVAGLTYTLADFLEYEKEYFWMVVPTNVEHGDAQGCEVWSFKTKDDPTIKTPFFEGFEDGYTHGQRVLGNWVQFTRATYIKNWMANNTETTYNRIPKSGNWNATLQYSGNSALIRPIELAADTDYQIEFYARQDGTGVSNAWIEASLASAPSFDAVIQTIVPQTGLTNGDYQEFGNTFSVDIAGIYYLVLEGWINNSPWYISLDDISIIELLDADPAPPILLAPIDGAIDMSANGFDLQWQPDLSGGAPNDYLVYLSMDAQAILESVPFVAANTSFNPVTEGPMQFGYEETWYWTVKARRNGVEVASEDVFSFTIEADPRVNLPYWQDFGDDGSFPSNWSQTFSGGLSSDRWSVSNTSNAGGIAWEMKNSYQNATGISRLISTPINTEDISELALSFKHYLSGYGTGCTGKVQYSHDLINWFDTDFSFSTASTIPAEEVNSTITGLNAPTTYIAWVMDGNHYQFNQWYLDDVNINFVYDYPDGIDTVYLDDEGNPVATITVDGGSANNHELLPGDWPTVNNGLYIPELQIALELFGAGPWTITIQTTAPWGAYYRNGNWTAVENTSGTELVFNIAAAKGGGLVIPITLGGSDPTLPVALSSFNAVLTADLHVKIAWVAESETNHAGYNLYRSEVDQLSTALKLNAGLILDGDNSGGQIAYEYLDTEVDKDANYYYWLESLSLNGEADYYGPLYVSIKAGAEDQEIPVIPLETKLYSAFPNPFNPATNLRYSMKEAGEAVIQVYNLKGQLVHSFHQSHAAPGYYQVSWNGRDQAGNPVASGVYFYRMTSGKYTATKKMIMSK